MFHGILLVLALSMDSLLAAWAMRCAASAFR